MKRRKRKGRVLRWLGLLLSLVVVGLWIHSSMVALRLNIGVRGSFFIQITSTWGVIEFASVWPTSSVPSGLGVTSWDNQGSSMLAQRGWPYIAEIVFRPPFKYGRIVPNPQAPGSQGVTELDVSHWLFFLLFAVPTALFWWRDHRRTQPGHCQRCSYDLTGSTSGTCPECGSPVPKLETEGHTDVQP
jgi:hypothetical protein